MTPTLCAILARFNGDRTDAVAYCNCMAMEYPNRCEEYLHYALALLEEK